MTEKGKYIIFGGGEGAGKSYHTTLIGKWFDEHNVPWIRIREPGGTPEAEKIRSLLTDESNNFGDLTELFLFEASRAEIFSRKIIPNLEKGINVISDRSCYCGEAYQGYAGGIDLSLIRFLNDVAMFKTKPDLAFLIDVDVEKGLSRETNASRFTAKGKGYHQKANQGYLDVAKFHSERCVIIPYLDGKPEMMQESIRGHIKERLGIPKSIS